MEDRARVGVSCSVPERGWHMCRPVTGPRQERGVTAPGKGAAARWHRVQLALEMFE